MTQIMPFHLYVPMGFLPAKPEPVERDTLPAWARVLYDLGACGPSLRWCAGFSDAASAWALCTNAGWMLWLVATLAARTGQAGDAAHKRLVLVCAVLCQVAAQNEHPAIRTRFQSLVHAVQLWTVTAQELPRAELESEREMLRYLIKSNEVLPETFSSKSEAERDAYCVRVLRTESTAKALLELIGLACYENLPGSAAQLAEHVELVLRDSVSLEAADQAAAYLATTVRFLIGCPELPPCHDAGPEVKS